MSDEPAHLPSVRAAFLYDPEGDAAIARYVLRHETVIGAMVRRERLVRLLGMFVSGPLLFVVAFFVLSSMRLIDATWIISVVLTIGFLLIAGSAVAYSGQWNAFMRKLRAASVRRTSLGERTEVEVTPRGIRFSSADSAREFGWKYVDSIERIESFIAIRYSHAINGVAVPLAAFESESDARKFEDGAKALLEASGYDNRTRVRTTLASRSLKCDQCGYQLRGVVEAKCPECGRALNSLALRCLEYLQLPIWQQVFSRRRVRQQFNQRQW